MTGAHAQHDARLEALEALGALSRALADPAAFLALVTDSDDEDDARRRLREAFGFDAVQARAVLDLQVGRLTRARRAAVEAEFRTLQDAVSVPWHPPLDLAATVRSPGRIEVEIDGVGHRVDGEDADDALTGLASLVRAHLAAPRRRTVVVTISGAGAGPTQAVVDPVGGTRFLYDDEAPT